MNSPKPPPISSIDDGMKIYNRAMETADRLQWHLNRVNNRSKAFPRNFAVWLWAVTVCKIKGHKVNPGDYTDSHGNHDALSYCERCGKYDV